MNILVYGSVAYDQIMDFPDSFSNHILPGEIKKLNVSFTVRQLKKTFGGTAGNIAYNLSLLKEKPVVYSAVGCDFEPYRERMVKLGINLSGIRVYNKTLTASVYIITDKDNSQILFPRSLAILWPQAQTDQKGSGCYSAGQSGGNAQSGRRLRQKEDLLHL
ncbi:MAG TPA: PfkB family carbohydrate kinase [Patescibacteria group bacterium]|nr:PfkB family carbohydrate kinase [Patescibacteria group bacterium]